MKEFDKQCILYGLDFTRADVAMEYKLVKVDLINWDNYDFNKMLNYLRTYGLRGRDPSLNSDWMKMLVNTQIFGGVGTVDDMISYAGWDPKRVINSRKYSIVNFLQYYHIVEQIKRKREGGRIFELTKFAEDLIDYAAKH